ncbi:uncharacterized protein LACBIDRAFT_302192 [Laccaria bicolor S238N-H82]|uniref:Predicted protein n=1 Tax=Laccaria bicolor (strain S238N-H82 / ATCC MYA-4686) TaxID=486041 RepID=B0DH95_LACBS|nr:uncharacterized protein LACBIDRAFT_302192 [Laccaria bicolor S238N-H82]EDR06072.1 predicted protein [Laccaria bicolor S238N-H82]|eukprot:XP_001883360.1 predicted protein [Laccaria bicolor S238N-H82]
MIILVIESYEYDHSSYRENRPPTSTTHILPDHQSRRIFTPEGMYGSMSMVASGGGELLQLITVIDPSFTSRRSTF